ncbi:hypothetical protein GWI33_009139 [Rhynchophorus ferrugineus]|uniref:Uncharacterized protein n=1 Tax=Rhynchophorus ferrugineus TaxID=354439 RepID=A0A834IH38_RHYFE|nr:hypothetical protein GWI33_009139 [Rhynchophorus ferrugineus]
MNAKYHLDHIQTSWKVNYPFSNYLGRPVVFTSFIRRRSGDDIFGFIFTLYILTVTTPGASRPRKKNPEIKKRSGSMPSPRRTLRSLYPGGPRGEGLERDNFVGHTYTHALSRFTYASRGADVSRFREAVTAAVVVAAAVPTAPALPLSCETSEIYYELCWKVVRGSLTVLYLVGDAQGQTAVGDFFATTFDSEREKS